MADGAGDTAKAFDAYEVIGVITPGTVVTLLLALEWPAFRALIGNDGLSIGDLGLFVLVAFVVGHLIQAVGNLVEFAVWPIGGLPTNWVQSAKQTLVSADQREALIQRVAAMEGRTIDIAHCTRAAWRAITSRAYGRVRAAGHSYMIDSANRTYGMCRGLTAAIAICLAWHVLFGTPARGPVIALIAALVAAVWRMRRAGTHYARSLIQAFIDLKQPVARTRPAKKP